VAVTKDNVAVVSHDPVLKSGTPIRTLTRDELPTEIPTLDQVFDLGRGNTVQFDVETKIFADQPDLTPGAAEFTELLLDSIRRHALESRVILLSFDPRTLRAIKKLEISIRRSALFETPRDWMQVARESEATALGPEYRLVTPDRVAEAHAAGLEVIPWTANQPEDWAKLAEAGCDAIISDDPGALIQWLKTRGLR
jgi:glycerophosphoryl diester phosphodiesterase